ncbi:MAG: SDR family NAD(P)-dependent oxidoreductase [Treponemataceae bacterium]
MKTVIIGASGGIGKSLTLEISKRIKKSEQKNNSKMDFVLQGKSMEKLNIICDLLKKNITAHVVDTDECTNFCSDFHIKTFSLDFFNFYKDFNLLPQNFMNEIKTADLLCICYGPFLQKDLHKMNAFEIQSICNLVFALPAHFICNSLPHMIQKKSGNIFVFGGTGTDSVCAFKTNAVYGAQKIALCSLVKSVAQNYAKMGIRCNAVLPGFVETEYVNLEQKRHYLELLGGQDMISTDEIAKISADLIFDERKNGVLFPYDKGWKRNS